jgi:hypothetical protein
MAKVPARPSRARPPSTAASKRPASTVASKRPAATAASKPAPKTPEPASTPAATAAQPSPVTLRIAVWLLAAEAVLLGVLSVVLLIGDLRGWAQTGQGAAGVIAYVATIAAVLGVLSWALHGRRGWARGPAIVLHMLMIPFGLALISGGNPLLGALGLLVGIAGTVVLLAPATRIAVGRG